MDIVLQNLLCSFVRLLRLCASLIQGKIFGRYHGIVFLNGRIFASGKYSELFVSVCKICVVIKYPARVHVFTLSVQLIHSLPMPLPD
jgi:hypothetical protein